MFALALGIEPVGNAEEEETMAVSFTIKAKNFPEDAVSWVGEWIADNKGYGATRRELDEASEIRDVPPTGHIYAWVVGPNYTVLDKFESEVFTATDGVTYVVDFKTHTLEEIPPEEEKSWLERHWKPVVGGTLAAILLGVAIKKYGR